MKGLTWWFRIVGAFYVLMGIGFFPPINEGRLPLMLSLDVPTTSVIYRALIDWMFTFGLDLLVTGGFMLYASRNPARHLNLVWLLVWLEAIRGIVDDLYLISRGIYSTPFYIGFIVVHLIIIGTGIALARQARAESGVRPASPSTRLDPVGG